MRADGSRRSRSPRRPRDHFEHRGRRRRACRLRAETVRGGCSAPCRAPVVAGASRPPCGSASQIWEQVRARRRGRCRRSPSIDTASYAGVRRFSTRGDPEAPCASEMITTSVPRRAPTDGSALTAAVGGVVPVDAVHRLVRVTLRGARSRGRAPPMIVMLCDVSGSMNRPTRPARQAVDADAGRRNRRPRPSRDRRVRGQRGSRSGWRRATAPASGTRSSTCSRRGSTNGAAGIRLAAASPRRRSSPAASTRRPRRTATSTSASSESGG